MHSTDLGGQAVKGRQQLGEVSGDHSPVTDITQQKMEGSDPMLMSGARQHAP
jgi:hypothetical protein